MGKKARKKAAERKKHSGIYADASGAKSSGAGQLEASLASLHLASNTGDVTVELERGSLMFAKEHQSDDEEGANITVMPISEDEHKDKDIITSSSSRGSGLSAQRLLNMMFFQAVKTNDLRYILHLIKKGSINPLIVNGNGENLLHIAAEKGYTNIVKHFCFGLNDPTYPRPRNEDMDIFERLVNTRDKAGNYPIDTAAKHNRHEIVSLLLSMIGAHKLSLSDYIISNYEEVLDVGTTVQQILAGLSMFSILKQTDNLEAFNVSTALSQKLIIIVIAFDPGDFMFNHISAKNTNDILKAWPRCEFVFKHISYKISEVMDQMSEKMKMAFFSLMSEILDLESMIKESTELMSRQDMKLLSQKLEEACEVLEHQSLDYIIQNVENANKVLWGLNALEQIGLPLLKISPESLKLQGQLMQRDFLRVWEKYMSIFCDKKPESDPSFDLEEIRSKIHEFSLDKTSLIDKKEKVEPSQLMKRLEDAFQVLSMRSLEDIVQNTKNANKALWALNALEQVGGEVLLAPIHKLSPEGKQVQMLFSKLLEMYHYIFYVKEEGTVELGEGLYNPEIRSQVFESFPPLDLTTVHSQIYESFSEPTHLIGKDKIDIEDGLLDSFLA